MSREIADMARMSDASGNAFTYAAMVVYRPADNERETTRHKTIICVNSVRWSTGNHRSGYRLRTLWRKLPDQDDLFTWDGEG